MIAFIIAPFFIALLIYVYISALKHFDEFDFKAIIIIKIVFALLLFGGAICILSGFFMPSHIECKRALTKIGYYWLGTILYFYISLIIAIVIRQILWLVFRKKNYNLKLVRKLTLAFVVLFTSIMSVYGTINAHNLHITNYEVEVNKKSNIDELNIVLIADLHLGYNISYNQIEDMVNKINDLNPDVVLLAGDIFDNQYEAIDRVDEVASLLNSINSKYGKYAVYGNHDSQEKIFVGFRLNYDDSSIQVSDEMNDFIRDSGFELLYDSYELIEDSIYIYGRPDKFKPNCGNDTRIDASDITLNLDLNKTIICLDHEPGELEELAKAGVDLDLSGHTHNGQIWPGTLLINKFWDNAYGLLRVDDMTSIVTSGVGLYGTNMRTGCFSEIVNIKLKFN